MNKQEYFDIEKRGKQGNIILLVQVVVIVTALIYFIIL